LSGPLLSYGGAYVTAGQFGAWAPIGAEQIAGGYEVAWKMGAADQYTIWTTDSSGNYLSQTAVLSGASLALQSLENSFHQDLNGDGVVGPVTTVIEASGLTTLAKVADSYSLYPVGGSSGPQLLWFGAYTVAGQFGAWTPIGAEHNASGGYEVAWKNGGADQYTVWTTDSNGNYLSQTAVLSGASLALQSLENSFHQDLNGDGVVGPVTTVIEASGSTRLAQVANTYSLYPLVGSSGPQLRYGGAATTVGQFGSWAAIGAEHNASGGYAVVWKNGGADQYTVWSTDSNGNYLSQTPTVTSASWYVQSLEPSFSQDLNGDGRIGPVTTVIESFGSTTLAKVADSYFLYPVGGSSGPQLLWFGAYTAAGQFGAWTPIGAEHNASGGYEVAWKNGGADQYTVWTTDSNGNYLSQTAVLAGASLALQSLEPSFHQDLNGDGTIGFHTAPIETSGNDSAAAVFTMSSYSMVAGEGASHLLVAASASVATLGSGTTIASGLGTETAGNGGSGAGSLTLLTSYLASTFVPPAGAGTGAVGEAQSSGQDFLSKPAA
jgi:serralysin